MPNCVVNLISIAELFKVGTDIQFLRERCKITTQKKTITTTGRNRCWFLDTTLKQQLALLSAEINPNTLRVWHNRLGHVAESTLLKLAEMSNEVNLTEPIPELTPYETCAISTLRLNPHKSHTQPGEAPLDFIHLDVLGPF